jgi:hypothetical protein
MRALQWDFEKAGNWSRRCGHPRWSRNAQNVSSAKAQRVDYQGVLSRLAARGCGSCISLFFYFEIGTCARDKS